MGFYVIDEADMESHGCVEVYNNFKWDAPEPYNGIALIACDKQFEKAITDRAEALVKRDINRPCVVFWSLGNESGWGENMLAAGRLVKSLDETRLLHYESTHRLDDTPTDILDVVSGMYWDTKEMAGFLESRTSTDPLCSANTATPWATVRATWRITTTHFIQAHGSAAALCGNGATTPFLRAWLTAG